MWSWGCDCSYAIWMFSFSMFTSSLFWFQLCCAKSCFHFLQKINIIMFKLGILNKYRFYRPLNSKKVYDINIIIGWLRTLYITSKFTLFLYAQTLKNVRLQVSNWTNRRSCLQEEETVVVWSHHPVKRTLKDHTTRHSPGWISQRVRTSLIFELGRVTSPNLGLAVRFGYPLGLVLS